MDYEELTIEEIEFNINRLMTDLSDKSLPQYLKNLKIKELEGFKNELNNRKPSFDSDATSYGRPQAQKVEGVFKPTPQGMKSGEDEIPPAVNMDIARQQVFGKTHASLNYCDALRTMGYPEDRIKAMCKEEGIKYDPPMFNVSSKPKVTKKNPVKQPNPIPKPQLKRLWD